MIQNFGGGELLAILILALVVLGPERIPEMAKSAGKMIAKFKSMTSGLQSQVQGVMDDPAMQPLKELGDFAARPRQKLAEYALEAEADERAKAEEAATAAARDATDADPITAETEPAETDTAASDTAASDTAASDTAASTAGHPDVDGTLTGDDDVPPPIPVPKPDDRAEVDTVDAPDATHPDATDAAAHATDPVVDDGPTHTAERETA